MQPLSLAPSHRDSTLANPPKDIRLLVLDIDGTIAGESNQVEAPVLKAIQAAQAKGVLVAIATGRMYQSALRFHRAIGAQLPLMAYQGALIQDPATDQVHRHWPVPWDLSIALLQTLEVWEEQSLLSIHAYYNDRLHVREMNEDTRRYISRSSIQPIALGDALSRCLGAEPTKILAVSEDTELIADLQRRLQAQYSPQELYLTRSVPTYLEATHPAVNKGTAVRHLAEELLGIPAEQVMAIGDNFNDIEMIEYAGLGIAMGNAPPELKAVANWVAPSVEEYGVAAAIEEFLI